MRTTKQGNLSAAERENLQMQKILTKRRKTMNFNDNETEEVYTEEEMLAYTE